MGGESGSAGCWLLAQSPTKDYIRAVQTWGTEWVMGVAAQAGNRVGGGSSSTGLGNQS